VADATKRDILAARGGFPTKVHVRVNAEGLPIGVVLTAGEAHDATAYPELMAERDSDPGILIADRCYDSDNIRQDARDRAATPEIPTRRNRKVQHSVDRRVYALRSRIECFMNKLKNNRRVATRYDNTAQLSGIRLARLQLDMVEICPHSLPAERLAEHHLQPSECGSDDVLENMAAGRGMLVA
jgi:transposase